MRFNPCNPCCSSGSTDCTLCDATPLPTDLYVALMGNNYAINLLFGVPISGYPYLDCVSDTTSCPPPYLSAGVPISYPSCTLNPLSHHVVWDAAFEVRTPTFGNTYASGTLAKTGAWYVDTTGCSGYSKFRVIFYCLSLSEVFAVDLVWFIINGESVEVVYGYLTTTATLTGGNTCDPAYFVSTGGGGWFLPDQTVSGNYMTISGTDYATFTGSGLYTVVTE